ncbi:MAG: hypothetical protein WAU45_07920 [Blastocatellia bacterium]
MDFLNQTRFIERLQFFNGQRLFASDLQGLEAFNREMRWLHNKSLHQPGIGNGFAVSGKKGEREVRVDPGYAIDIEGREIVQTQTALEPIPPVSSEVDGSPVQFDLTVSYPPIEDLEETETREGVCAGQGVVRRKEEPVFCWVRLDRNGQPLDPKIKTEILGGLRIVLARAEVLDCSLNKDVSIAERLSARPASQPYICCGHVDAVEWKVENLVAFDLPRVLGSSGFKRLQAQFQQAVLAFPLVLPISLSHDVDTSECGFLTTPCYTARVAGPRVFRFPVDIGDGVTEEVSIFAEGLPQITESEPDHFVADVQPIIQILTPFTFPLAQTEDLLKQLTERMIKEWRLEWMGVEG